MTELCVQKREEMKECRVAILVVVDIDVRLESGWGPGPDVDWSDEAQPVILAKKVFEDRPLVTAMVEACTEVSRRSEMTGKNKSP